MGDTLGHLERQRILTAARRCFAREGLEGTAMADLAAEADLPLEAVFLHFPCREAVAMGLYSALADALIEGVPDLPVGSVAARFRAAMLRKIDLLEPQRSALLAMMGAGLDPGRREGVLGPHAGIVRARVSSVFHAVAEGASDVPAAATGRVGRLLYGLHLLLVLLWTQDTSSDRGTTLRTIDLLADLITMARPLAGVVPAEISSRLDGLFGPLLGTPRRDGERVGRILERLFMQRRCRVPGPPSVAALAVHAPLVAHAVTRGAPLELVLPAFPAKAPNLSKVLGPLPDMAERVALRSLQRLCDDLTALHPPGAHLIVASDGRVFADAVGVTDADVDRYRAALEEMMTSCGSLTFFGLRDVFPARSPSEARAALMAAYGETIEALKDEMARSQTLRALVDGVHRFMAEDLRDREPGLSRSQCRKRARPVALEVVRRSHAWGRLFPEAVRLSIHPQPDVSPKIGVHLIDTDDIWRTPWHGAAVLTAERFRLMRRADAEGLGARVITAGGRPDHLRLDITSEP